MQLSINPLLVLSLGFGVLEREIRCIGLFVCVLCGVVGEAVAVPVLHAFERFRSGLFLRCRGFLLFFLFLDFICL